MSTTRDTNFRPMRSDELYSRDPAPSPGSRQPAPSGGHNNDPLAELARLIGQEDPYASLGRQAGRTSRPAAEPREEPPQWLSRPSAPSREAAPDHGQGSHLDPHVDETASAHDPRYEDEGRYETDDRHDAYASDAYYDDGQEPYDEEGYAAPAPAKRGRMMIVAAVIGLALIGTAGIFGYQAWTSPSGAGGEPPVIKAEPAPTKVPAAPSGDNQLNKQSYDRVGDSGGERVVPREEQPVDPRSAVRAAAPAAGPGATPAFTGSVLPPFPAPAQSSAAGGTEPKKVKTETIRPNEATRPSQAGTATAANASARVANAPSPGAPAAAGPAPATTRSVSATAPAAPVRATANPESGGYVVQVASQRSEADAHASFKSLQHKYPTVLGGYQVMVRRADLGDRGVYYRAQVGPFATAEQASEMCSSLKSAGGQCLVQRN